MLGSESSTTFLLPGTKVACYFHYRDRMFVGVKVPPMELSLLKLKAKVHGNESSIILKRLQATTTK